MANPVFVENKNYLHLAGDIIQASRRTDTKDKLCAQIKWAREYVAYNRQNYDRFNSWDCGRQDAYVDRVSEEFRKLRVLFAAYELQKGTAKRLSRVLEEAFNG